MISEVTYVNHNLIKVLGRNEFGICSCDRKKKNKRKFHTVVTSQIMKPLYKIKELQLCIINIYYNHLVSSIFRSSTYCVRNNLQ